MTTPVEVPVFRVMQVGETAVHEGAKLRAPLARFDDWCLRSALERNLGRRAETARTLGLTREGLYKKMKRLGIE